jgi:hypothetical protein
MCVLLLVQVYIIVLVREEDAIRFISVGLGGCSVAINVALMFGDNQPSTAFYPCMSFAAPRPLRQGSVLLNSETFTSLTSHILWQAFEPDNGLYFHPGTR